MLIYQGKLSGIFSKGRYFRLSHFSFHETKECIPHKAQTVFFFPALQGRNKAISGLILLIQFHFSAIPRKTHRELMNILHCFFPSFLWKKDLSRQILQIQYTQFSQQDSREVFAKVERQDMPVFSTLFCQRRSVRYYFPQSSKKQWGKRNMLLYSTNYSEMLWEAASQNVMIFLLLLCGPTVFRIWTKPNQTKSLSCTNMCCILKINRSTHLAELYLVNFCHSSPGKSNSITR